VPTYFIVETSEHRIEAHCEACAKEAFLEADSASEFICVPERSIELEQGREPEDAHDYYGGF
jgi:hypothetical protein